MKPRCAFLVAGLFAGLSAATAAGASPEAIQQLVKDYLDKKPSTSLQPGFDIREARRTQKAFVTQLSQKFGPIVGYKVGLTSKAVQESVGASAPVRGVLLKEMLLSDRAEVSAGFGARPIYEVDLIVTVKDAGINNAKTPLEVAQHLDEVVGFIELPDRVVAESVKVDGNLITAVNAGARLGVLGQRRKIEPTAAFVTALEKIVVTATDEKGAPLVKATGDALLGNPLNAVLWLVEDFKATGERLKAGDVISLGGFARPEPPRAGQTIKVRYEGLPGGPLEVSVRFKD
jgi:2-keto-4-pentenoate hydratase